MTNIEFDRIEADDHYLTAFFKEDGKEIAFRQAHGGDPMEYLDGEAAKLSTVVSRYRDHKDFGDGEEAVNKSIQREIDEKNSFKNSIKQKIIEAWHEKIKKEKK